MGTIEVDTPCREWGGATTYNGYGVRAKERKKLGIEYGSMLVHRQVWEMMYGSIDEDTMVLHKCDNRLCYRLDHLYLGTAQDNSNDMVRRNRKRGPNKLPDDSPCLECGNPRKRTPNGRLLCYSCHAWNNRNLYY